MKTEKIPESEYCKTNSNYSAMRKGFFMVVKAGLILAFVITLGYVGCYLAEKPLPIEPLIALDGTILGIAFAGKTVQTFGEKPEVTEDTKDESKTS
jgi:hypothetical protein